MRKQPTLGSPEAVLARVLDALEQELIDASNEEILEAAKDLGMNPMMKGSAAFLGLKYWGTPQFSDFFDAKIFKQIQAEMQRLSPKP